MTGILPAVIDPALFEEMNWLSTLQAESAVTAVLCPQSAFARFAATLEQTECAELKRRAALDDDLKFLMGSLPVP